MKKKLVSALLAASMIVMSVPAYGSAESGSDFIGPFEKYPEQVDVNISGGYDPNDVWLDGDTAEDNPVTRYLTEKTNIKLHHIWSVSNQDYNQKLSLAIASGDLPDVFSVNDRAILQELIDNDLIEDLTGTYESTAADYVKDMYESYGEDAFSTGVYDGKLLAIPDLCYGYQFNFTWIRKDWLDKVGLDIPETKEDLETALQAFVDNKLGGENTIGMVVNADNMAGVYNNVFGIDPWFNHFGSYPASWMVDEDGTVKYGSVQPETKEALAYIADLYQKGLVDKEIGTRTNDINSELLVSGQCGAFFGTWYMADWPCSKMYDNDPTAEWVPVLGPVAEDGKFHTGKQNIHMNWVVVRKGYEHPEVPWQLINYQWLRGADEELEKITDEYHDRGGSNGSFGPTVMVQYNDAIPRDGASLMKALETGDTSELVADPKMFYPDCKRYVDGDVDTDSWRDYMNRVVGSSVAVNPSHELVIQDIYYPLTTPTMSLSWTNMKDLETQTFLKIIRGDQAIDTFDEFVSQWNAMGGEQITKEVNEAYQAEQN